MDTVMGADQAGPCVLTVVERATGSLIVQLLDARIKEQAGDGLCRVIMKMKGVMKTITADNGTESSGAEEVEGQFPVPFYFAKLNTFRHE